MNALFGVRRKFPVRSAPSGGYFVCMADPRTDVLVIGAGVSGLTTSIGLIEAGLPASSLRLIAETPSALTTSCSAGAIWGPYLSSSDQDTDEWGRHTMYRLRDLAGEPSAGVYM